MAVHTQIFTYKIENIWRVGQKHCIAAHGYLVYHYAHTIGVSKYIKIIILIKRKKKSCLFFVCIIYGLTFIYA